MSDPILTTLAAALAVLAVLTSGAYYLFYRAEVNKRLNSSRAGDKKLWSPLKVCLASVIGALSVFAAICLVQYAANSAPWDGQTQLKTYHARFFSREEMREGYLRQYSVNENKGYRRTEKRIDDVKYTYFISEQDADAFHPAFIIYAQYVGEDNPQFYDVSISFLADDGTEVSGMMVGGCETGEPIVCAVGNSFTDCGISFIADFYSVKREDYDLNRLKTDNTPLFFPLPEFKAG